ncbi:cell division protein FtsZ [Campylobacter ureolyticus]|uniref:Cell division protein FtsZ n=1 Tax=Campylobacter ureolyticus TaxID=827 RepID=A0A9Q4KN96_9BACT|nr:cell division protein FtsZ [Campylobacter ureolyticus]MCZ6103079.1 cell division protein FtsZ [Campylobacter ureolyticus]MCZ6134159.1 cell division protein FtsZ [Campylobacter ureolyticus]MCZ6161205.1 cell division protein FtsZ [Campylobacter ureolyticus]MCZ6170511.1 cell division protein FtsZ [Campylobacter ureolyticus]MDU4980985.1 cell division protein FtsZ [Campylobacter ureolyticus]
MNGFTIEENKGVYGAKMKVIGVGGGGGNMINHMIREGYDRIDLLVANTDSQALENSLAKTKILLGEKTAKTLGAGMDPTVGKDSAEESFDTLKDALEYSDIVFVASGLGGGTGTGASPVVARAAKENKALTIGVVTTPFKFEGKKRASLAQTGINELKKECDSILVIPNQKLLSLIDKKAGIKESFKMVDDVLARAVGGMSSIILDSGDSDINLDFADVKKIMSHRGLALMGVGASEGEDAPKEAIQDAIQSPLLDDMSINGAMGVLIHFKIHPDCSLLEISEAVSLVEEAAHDNADIIFGTTTDASIENNRVEVTLIATGFEETSEKKEDDSQKDSLDETKVISRRQINQRVSGSDIDLKDIYDNLDEPTYLRYKAD